MLKSFLKKINIIALLFFISFHLISFLASYVSNYVMYSSFAVWLLTAFVCSTKRDQEYLISCFTVMLFFGAICFVSYYLGGYNFDYYFQNYIYLFFYSMIIVPTLHNMTLNECKFILFAILLMIMISSVATYVGLEKYPLAARELATGKYDEFDLSLYEHIGIMNYGYIYGLTLLPAAMISCRHFNNIFIKILLLAFAVFCIIIIFRANYALAIIITVISMFLTVLINQFADKSAMRLISIFLILSLFLIVYFLRVELFQLLLSFLARNSSQIVYHRFEEIYSHFIIKTDNDSLQRITLYGQSLNTFFTHLLTGSRHGLGGHSEIFDVMGKYGIWSFVYIGFMFWTCRMICKTLSRPLSKRRYNVVFLTMFIIAILNPISTGKAIMILGFIVMPLYIFIYEKVSNEKTVNNKLNIRPREYGQALSAN